MRTSKVDAGEVNPRSTCGMNCETLVKMNLGSILILVKVNHKSR